MAATVGAEEASSSLLDQLESDQLLAAALALGGLLLIALFWGLYAGTPPTQACADGSGTCPAQLPASLSSPAVLLTFAAGYVAILSAALLAFPSRLLLAVAAMGALLWALPAVVQLASGGFGEVGVGFFAAFVIGAATHVSMPAIVLRTAIRRFSLGLVPVVAVGVAGVAMVVLAQVVGDVAPAPLAGSVIAFWGFGGAVAAVANQPWKLPGR